MPWESIDAANGCGHLLDSMPTQRFGHA